MRRNILYDLLALLCITIPLILFFLRFVYPVPQLIITPDFGQSDAITGFTTKFIYSQALSNGTIPFWSSHIGGGYPLYANGGVGVWYIPNILLFYFLPAELGYLASLFISMLLLGWGMYAWLRALSLDRMASLFAGVTIALSGYVIVQFTHLTIVQSVSLYPWILYASQCIVKRAEKKYILLLAVVYAQLLFIGFAQSIFITTLSMIGYVAWFSTALHTRLRSFISIGIATIIGLLLSAVHLLPAMEFLGQIQSNGIFEPGAATLFSYPLSHVITLLDPYLRGNPANGTFQHVFASNGSIFWENTAYIGILPLLLCVIALLRYLTGINTHASKRSNTDLYSFFSCALVAAFFLMTGKHSPIYFIFSFYPFSLFRVPSRFIWVFIVSLVVIASISFGRELESIKKKRTKILVGCLLILIQILNSLYLFSAYHNTEPAREWLRDPSLVAHMREGYTLTIGGESLYNSIYQTQGWVRMNNQDRPSYTLRNTFTPDKNSLWGISQIHDYSGRELKRSKIMSDLLAQAMAIGNSYATISATGEKLLSLYGISNVISTLPLTHTALSQKAALSHPRAEITLFDNPHSLPKAYIAQETIQVETMSQAVGALVSDSFILGKTALIDRDIHASLAGALASLTIESRRDGHFELSLTPVDHESLVVVTENYYPGWRATADGKTIELIPVNVSQIGLLVPKHTARVTLDFLPTYFIPGLWISVVTFVIIVIAAILL